MVGSLDMEVSDMPTLIVIVSDEVGTRVGLLVGSRVGQVLGCRVGGAVGTKDGSADGV